MPGRSLRSGIGAITRNLIAPIPGQRTKSKGCEMSTPVPENTPVAPDTNPAPTPVPPADPAPQNTPPAPTNTPAPTPQPQNEPSDALSRVLSELGTAIRGIPEQTANAVRETAPQLATPPQPTPQEQVKRPLSERISGWYFGNKS